MVSAGQLCDLSVLLYESKIWKQLSHRNCVSRHYYSLYNHLFNLQFNHPRGRFCVKHHSDPGPYMPHCNCPLHVLLKTILFEEFTFYHKLSNWRDEQTKIDQICSYLKFPFPKQYSWTRGWTCKVCIESVKHLKRPPYKVMSAVIIKTGVLSSSIKTATLWSQTKGTNVVLQFCVPNLRFHF